MLFRYVVENWSKMGQPGRFLTLQRWHPVYTTIVIAKSGHPEEEKGPDGEGLGGARLPLKWLESH